jgi:hypothetical protein
VANGRLGVSGTRILRAFPLAALGSGVDDAPVRSVAEEDATDGPVTIPCPADLKASSAFGARLCERSLGRLSNA